MKIGIYITGMWAPPGTEALVSGHIQVPLHAARQLHDAGHEVAIITTPRPLEHQLPDCFPEQLQIFEIQDPSRQSALMIRNVGRRRGAKPWALISSLQAMRQIARRNGFDWIHFYGGPGTAHLAAVFRLTQPPCRVALTLNVGRVPTKFVRPIRWLWSRLDRLITSTQYFQEQLSAMGLKTTVIRHGPVRDLNSCEGCKIAPRTKHRVLFWREATRRNGGDIAVNVFRRLAPLYPHIQFDFAVRSHWQEAEGLKQLESDLQNVTVYRSPYADSCTLQHLLAESICVLQPFREFTIQPQLSILETIYAGVPVIATDIQSIAEIITDSNSGKVFPVIDEVGMAQAIQHFIEMPQHAVEVGENARITASARWNWQQFPQALERVFETTV